MNNGPKNGIEIFEKHLEEIDKALNETMKLGLFIFVLKFKHLYKEKLDNMIDDVRS